ncbi:hypothetical protein FC70_GL001751 [Paucilactobacillus oligofermentans DSM 15707 = LMG 22743]|uniref:Uncharacterized protein n=1 Tax=Paucilactobacillus oligofermentans DSM 15707 = LMG 22743 TaxID=1423778 RepID=A0A0R1RI81_9LACO|nr:phage tail tube assembly chaperone [Paucilactobacillus oligofermentans]KRL54948.1 hypothetical protein FC70_GL001751 [Paucilactobacillus oligofermentans DSM 15707 = LMG 22743]CUS26135.1 Phage tail component protein [Paucilactobacillus oligofermentans DSM 15707 = LMG 22743]
MSIKIKVNELNKDKPFFVKTTNANMRLVLNFQLLLAKSDDLSEQAKEDADSVKSSDMLKEQLKIIDSTTELIQNILHLNEKQLKRLDDMETEDSILLANRITMRMNGFTEKEIQKMYEEDVDDEGKE